MPVVIFRGMRGAPMAGLGGSVKKTNAVVNIGNRVTVRKAAAKAGITLPAGLIKLQGGSNVPLAAQSSPSVSAALAKLLPADQAQKLTTVIKGTTTTAVTAAKKTMTSEGAAAAIQAAKEQAAATIEPAPSYDYSTYSTLPAAGSAPGTSNKALIGGGVVAAAIVAGLLFS